MRFPRLGRGEGNAGEQGGEEFGEDPGKGDAGGERIAAAQSAPESGKDVSGTGDEDGEGGGLVVLGHAEVDGCFGEA